MSQSADRQRLIRLIHVAKRDLSMDDDTYRQILRRFGKRASSAELSVPDLERVLEHMKRCGFKVRPKAKPSRALAQDRQSKKIRALWLFLHHLQAVKNPSEEALAAYVKRITGVDALQWIDGAQAERLIETMKRWAMRFLPQAVRNMVPLVGEITDVERAQLDMALSHAFTAGTFDPMHAAWDRLNDILTRGR
ncbi:regulatory protein GemA [Pandoraea pnomenusa]|uniref:gp16 family protein n=1 Tax=Pandoraea pnomenusa TaxID=93220 RepID=UPI003342ACBE